LIVAGTIHLGCIISPPSLMDDVDAVQAQIARNMLTSGDWVTARLDGVAYLEKAPLIYWMIAGFYRVFGVHDWVARLPIALCRLMPGHMRGAVSFYSDFDPRRYVDCDGCPGYVGVAANPR
jgi:4-amino-4-deoxy-L-arabinose transferase-like glycosyltransferase